MMLIEEFAYEIGYVLVAVAVGIALYCLRPKHKEVPPADLECSKCWQNKIRWDAQFCPRCGEKIERPS